MCGRYFLQLNDQETYFFQEQRMQQEMLQFQQGEVFPSQDALVLCRMGQKDIVPDVMKWGIHGYRGNLLINARMEGIHEKYTFRPLLSKRCAIVANGFYEWVKHGTKKDKIYVQKEASPIIYFAGIYNDQKEFVIVTGASQDTMADVHDRTPILMEELQMRAYLALQRDFIVDNEHLLFHKV